MTYHSPLTIDFFPDTFTDLTIGTDYDRELSGNSKLSTSFGYFWIKGRAQRNRSYSSNMKYKSRTHTVVATMRIERYYASLKEESSPLSDDALTLLDNQDYIGFFKSCGPNYVRGIRRAQEIVAMFTFESTSLELAHEYSSNLKSTMRSRYSFFRRRGQGQLDSSFQSKSKFSSINDSLTIEIQGYGLGLNTQGSDTLVATSLEEFNDAMKFAFRSFTQNEDSHNIGMVYGMEVVPWVDNTAFQVASRLLEEDIEVPIPRSLIPKMFPRNATATSMDDFNNDFATRSLFKCKDPTYMIDKYGYCCDPETLYNPADAIYEDEAIDVAVSERVCKPLSVMDKSVTKNNMANNAEFVARLDSIVRYRLNQLFTLEKCISAVRAIPDKYKYYIVKSQDSVKYDKAIEFSFTVAELRTALDPKADYGFVKHMGRELDEFIDMYYQPCVAALFGMNIGVSPGTDPQYFMAYPWYNHDECNHLSCLADNMRWDRETKGCVPSLMTGAASPSYNGTDCSFDGDQFGDTEECKYSGETLNQYRADAKHCWKANTVPIYLMDHFCLPDITGAVADAATIGILEAEEANCTSGVSSGRRLYGSEPEPVVTWSQRDAY